MTKRTIFATIAVALIAGVSIFVACSKEEKNEKQNIVSNAKSFYDDRVTLSEFASSMETDDEISFFQQNEATDHSNVYPALLADINANNFTGDAFRVKIKFSWGSNCTTPTGICFIITYFADMEDNATLYLYNGKCVIVPDSEENGLTADLYSPVFEDVYINDMLAVKHGIYKACYDESTETIAIVTDVTNNTY